MTSGVPASFADYAQRLLAHEAGGRQSTEDIMDALDRICQSLNTRLTPLLSDAGVNALFARALSLAGREYSFLMAAGTIKDCSLDGLRQTVHGRNPAEASDAVVAILANFLWLLVTFIGQDLGLRKVHEGWPDLPFTAPGSPSEKAEP
jgi:hypothetical protein